MCDKQTSFMHNTSHHRSRHEEGVRCMTSKQVLCALRVRGKISEKLIVFFENTKKKDFIPMCDKQTSFMSNTSHHRSRHEEGVRCMTSKQVLCAIQVTTVPTTRRGVRCVTSKQVLCTIRVTTIPATRRGSDV